MTNHIYQLQQSIIIALKEDMILSAMINNVYNKMPADAKFPCIAVENSVARQVTTRTANIWHVGMIIKIFSRARTNQEVSNVITEIKRILDGDINPTECRIVGIKNISETILRLNDGVTWSGDVNFVVILQEGEEHFIADGDDFVIKIGNGASPEVFTTIGGLQNVSISMANKVIDTSNVESGKWRTLMEGAGIHALSIGGNGFFTDSVAERLMEDAAFSKSCRNYEIIMGNNEVISGKFMVAAYKRSGSGLEEEYGVVLESSGEVVIG